jgi:hypothetical protein
MTVASVRPPRISPPKYELSITCRPAATAALARTFEHSCTP